MEELKKMQMQIDEQTYDTHTTPAFERKQKWTHPDDRIITSIIPGTIIDVPLKVGQEVKEGEIMIIIEAMKMNNRLVFNNDGVIDKILVKPGDIVSRGQELIVLK